MPETARAAMTDPMGLRSSVLSLSLIATITSGCGGDDPAEQQPPPIAPPELDPFVVYGTLDPPHDHYDELELAPFAPPAAPEELGPRGFIGSPCRRDSDCEYDSAICLTETDGFPGGMCSVACDRFCEDRAGHPITFCVDTGAIAADTTRAGSGGACISRCNFELYPGTGCREGYGCVEESRFNDPQVSYLSCLPGAMPEPLEGCHEQLVALGINFEITTRADDHPEENPELTCHIEQPVILHPPIRGIDFTRPDGSRTPNVLAACRMALALVATLEDLAARDVVRLIHWGTYNCRPIAGTDRLSRHGYADAIDIVGVELANGAVYTVENDFEQDVDPPLTAGGRFLFDAVHRWHDARIWSIILTPNYNAAHRDHFHVDLTPGSHYLHQAHGSWIFSVDHVD